MAAADRHKNALVVGIRGADEDLRDGARAAAVAAGYPDLSAATVAYWCWLTRRAGAASPRRPEAPAVVARQLLAELAAVLGSAALDPADRSRILAEASSLQAGRRGER